MKARALVVVLFLAACGPHEPPCSFALDPAFTAEERAAFDRAAIAWSTATNGRAHVDFDAPWPPHDDHYVRRVDLPGNLAGRAYWHYGPLQLSVEQDHIDIDPSATAPHHLPWVIAHELGHHWGMGHSRHSDDLMHPLAAGQISERDARRFCNVHGC
jgi:hypothetical protein